MNEWHHVVIIVNKVIFFLFVKCFCLFIRFSTRHLTSEHSKQVRYQVTSVRSHIILCFAHYTYHATAATAAPGGKIHSHCPGTYANLNMLIISTSSKHGRTQLMPMLLGIRRLLLAHFGDLLY